MKRFNVIWMAALLILASAPASQAAIDVEGSAYAGVFDKYLWRGFNLSGGQPVLQSGVDVSALGATFSYWSNIQLSAGGGQPSGDATEVNVVVDYTMDVNELLSLSVGNIFYTFNTPAAATNELYLGATVNTLLSPSLLVFWDWDIADGDGLFYAASVSHTFPVLETLGVNLSALISYNQESPYVGDYRNLHNYELGISVDYALTDQIVITPSFIFSSPISSAAKNVIDDEILAGINLAFNF